MKPTLHVMGMHGMGDCLHQRAVLRQLMVNNRVILETSWASMYHDLVGPDLTLIRKASGLRTQAKNVQREADKFTPMQPARGRSLRVAYGGASVLQTPSKTILEAMCNATGTDYGASDYSLPVPDAWTAELDRHLPRHVQKPILIYRPLVARPEWLGSVIRNADPASYAALFAKLRDTFYVISVADLEPGKEWLVGPQLRADLTLHRGELTFEALAALFAHADLIYTSSGFAAILAPAVGTACLSVTGGYESVGCHASGADYAPFLSVGPRVECSCWTSACRRPCDKRLDMVAAISQVRAFMSELCIQIRDNTTPFAEMYAPAAQDTAPRPPATVFEQQMRGR